MDSVAEIGRSGPMDALVAENVFYTGSFVKLTASAGPSGEEGRCDLFSSSFKELVERAEF